MSLTRRPSTPVMPIPQPTSRHDTISPAHNHVESKPGPTYRDRIFEYHVVAPLLLKAIDKSYPHEIPASRLYRATATYMVDSKDPMVVDYWAHLCDHDKAWFVQNFLVLLGDSNLGRRLVADDTKYLNVMLESTPELDQLVPHDEWMEMARHAAATRWDGSGRYDDLLQSYGLPVNALTMWQVDSFHPDDFDDAWDLLLDDWRLADGSGRYDDLLQSYGLPVNALTMWQVDSFHPDDFDDAWDLLLDDWRLAARDEGIDTGIEGMSKPDWFYRLEAKSRDEEWFLRKAREQEESTQGGHTLTVTGDDESEDASWNDRGDALHGSSSDDDWMVSDDEVNDDVRKIDLEADNLSSMIHMTQDDHVDSKMSYPRSTDKSDYDRVGERPSWDLGNGVIGADA